MVRALHVRDDSISITTNGKTNALYGSIEAPQTWTCDVHGETHAFNSSQVYKIIPAYPAIGGPAVRIWEKPAIGGFIEVQCDGGFDQANLRFRPENSENTLDIPWSDVHDVVPRATQ
jgi:hypothetical protein